MQTYIQQYEEYKQRILNDEELTKGYIKIPNVVVNTKGLEIGAKYLYGYITYWSYNCEFYKSSDEICDTLEISLSTLRKYLKKLKELNYIKIEIINQNKRRIIPLIHEGIILETKKNIEHAKARALREIQEPNLTPEQLNKKLQIEEFLKAIK